MNDSLQRYIEAATGLTQVTAKKAERIVKGMVRQGEAAGDQVGELVEDLVERSGRNREAILALVKAESTHVVRSMGLATNKEIDRLQKQVADLKRSLTRSQRSSAGEDEAAPTKKTGAKKTAAKKTGAKKTAAKKTGAKKTGAKKTAAKKTAAKKTGAKKTGAKKTTAKTSATAPAAAPAVVEEAAEDVRRDASAGTATPPETSAVIAEQLDQLAEGDQA